MEFRNNGVWALRLAEFLTATEDESISRCFTAKVA